MSPLRQRAERNELHFIRGCALLRRQYRAVAKLCNGVQALHLAARCLGCSAWRQYLGEQAIRAFGKPALHDALEFARSGDTLIVWKLDRLALSMKQLIETVEALRARGIGFRSLTEALDTTTAQGRLVFHMFGALAEFERSLIRERTQAGLAAARRAGRTGGRPPKLTDDDIEAAKALLANPDIGVTQIAHRLGVSPATLYRYIPAARTANTPDV
jgi:DNA invertase Pin-like site-specific DNA recombinase